MSLKYCRLSSKDLGTEKLKHYYLKMTLFAQKLQMQIKKNVHINLITFNIKGRLVT